MPKAETAFSRNNAVYDTTIGWRFVNKLMKEKYGVDSMPETAENVAVDFQIERRRKTRWPCAASSTPWPPSRRPPGARNRARHHPAEEERPLR